MHHRLFYDAVENDVAARAPYRKAHLLHAMAAHPRCEIILAGALSNPADDAVIVFQRDSPQAAEDFAKNEPYVQNGINKSWRVREWGTMRR